MILGIAWLVHGISLLDTYAVVIHGITGLGHGVSLCNTWYCGLLMFIRVHGTPCSLGYMVPLSALGYMVPLGSLGYMVLLKKKNKIKKKNNI